MHAFYGRAPSPSPTSTHRRRPGLPAKTLSWSLLRFEFFPDSPLRSLAFGPFPDHCSLLSLPSTSFVEGETPSTAFQLAFSGPLWDDLPCCFTLYRSFFPRSFEKFQRARARRAPIQTHASPGETMLSIEPELQQLREILSPEKRGINVRLASKLAGVVLPLPSDSSSYLRQCVVPPSDGCFCFGFCCETDP